MNNYNPNTGAFMASNDNPYKTEKSEKIKQTKLDEILTHLQALSVLKAMEVWENPDTKFFEMDMIKLVKKAEQQISELIDDVIGERKSIEELKGLMYALNDLATQVAFKEGYNTAIKKQRKKLKE